MSKGLTTVLHEVVWAMDRKADQIIRRDYGISLSWFRLLIVLRNTAPLTQHGLAEHLNHSDPAVSRLLERMSTSGLVSITIDPAHRRKRLVKLTTSGRELVDSADSALEALFRSDLERADIDIDGFTSAVVALSLQLAPDRTG